MRQVFLKSVWLWLLCACVLGCSLEPRANQSTQPRAGHESRTKEGPLEVRLRAHPLRITMADSIFLVLEAQVEPGWRVDWPRIEGALDPFHVLNQTRTSQKLSSGQILDVVTLELELDALADLKSGAAIPSLTFRFGPLSSPDLPLSELQTKAIPIEVEQLLGDSINPDQLRPARGPVSLPRIPLWILFLALAALALGLAMIAFARRRPSRQISALKRSTPLEEALAAMKGLRTQGLLEQGKTAAFLERLAQIIRLYIEGRFGIRAPERTTEEFLVETAQSPVFRSTHRKILRHFLEQADLAKFAKFKPSEKSVLQSFKAAEQFLVDSNPAPT